MVHAVVLGVVGHVNRIDVHAVGALPRAFIVVGMHVDGVRQVQHVAHLSVLEQRGIALGGNLLHLPLDGRQQHAVFTGVCVGRDNHAVQRGVYRGLVVVFLVVGLVRKDLVAGGLLAVLNVEDQPGGIVALQGEHHLQVVAQVVSAQRVAQGQFALVLTTADAAYQFDARVVVEQDAGLIGLEVVHLLCVLVVSIVVAVLQERVSVLHGLDGVRLLQHAEGVLALMVGGDEACGVAHLMTIHQEVDTLYGDAGAAVHDVAGKLHALAHLDDDICHHVVARLDAEEHRHGVHAHAAHRQRVLGFGAVHVGQQGEAEVAAVIGRHRACLTAALCDDDGLAGNTRAVEEAQVALHRGGLHAHTLHLLGLVPRQALATGHAAYLIFILVDGRCRLVLILHVGQLCGDALPGLRRVLRVGAPYLVVVHRIVRLVGPRQHHRGGQRLGFQRVLVYLAVVLVVEGGQGGSHRHFLRLVNGFGHHVEVAVLRPLVGTQQGYNLVAGLAIDVAADTIDASVQAGDGLTVLHPPVVDTQFQDEVFCRHAADGVFAHKTLVAPVVVLWEGISLIPPTGIEQEAAIVFKIIEICVSALFQAVVYIDTCTAVSRDDHGGSPIGTSDASIEEAVGYRDSSISVISYKACYRTFRFCTRQCGRHAAVVDVIMVSTALM